MVPILVRMKRQPEETRVMRVTIISTYPPQSCGIGSYTSYLADALTRSGCDAVVTVLTELQSKPAASGHIVVRPCFDSEADYGEPVTEGVEAARADVVHIQHEYGIFGFDDRFPELLRRLRRDGHPTVVTLHTVHTASSIDFGCARRIAHHPPPGFDVERYQRHICEWADRVVVHQERTIRQVLLRQGAAASKVITIPHGTLVARTRCRTETRATLEIGTGSELLVALGYFEPAKNLLNLLEAVATLRSQRRNIRLLVGGYIRQQVPETLEYMAACRQYIDRHGLADCVTVLPRALTEQEMTDVFAAADVACFVYDEDTRSSSGALHRALGCGIPVVASRIPKFDELSEAADELLVSPRSPGELARLLACLLDDADMRVSMMRLSANIARRTAWPRVAEQHESLYSELAHQCTSKRSRLGSVDGARAISPSVG